MYYVYEITNNINNRTYTGVTSCLIQNGKPYMGSGTALRLAKEKYGIENFSRKILFETECEELAYFIESEMVDSKAVDDRTNYNLNEGGKGGWGYVNRNIDKSGQKNGMYRKNFEKHHNWIELPEGEIVQLYHDGYSSTQIGEMFGVEKKTILRRLKKNGIELRKGSPYSRKK